MKKDSNSETMSVAGKFAYLHLLWLRYPNKIRQQTFDNKYDSSECFDSMDSQLQGQLQDLYDVVPLGLHKYFKKAAFWKTVSRCSV